MTGGERERVFFPHLDGLRFFSFLAVFLYHSFYTDSAEIRGSTAYHVVKRVLLSNGNLGVNFFFVLSGFLITFLLLREQEVTGAIDVWAFYVRRILRIWPLYFACVLFGFVAFPALKLAFGQQPSETADPLRYMLFLSNFDMLKHGLPDSSTLSVLWSVAVEEQFYLSWPLVLSLVPVRRWPWLFPSIVAGSVLFRWGHSSSPAVLELHTLAVICDMAIGGWAALLAHSRPRALEAFRNIPRLGIAGLYLAVGIVLLWRGQLFATGWGATLDGPLVGAIFAGVIVEQCYAEKSLFKIGNLATVSTLGKYTYGMYCLHPAAGLIALWGPWRAWTTFTWLGVFALQPAIALGVTVVASYLSFRYFEGPFLRLKSRFQHVTRGD